MDQGPTVLGITKNIIQYRTTQYNTKIQNVSSWGQELSYASCPPPGPGLGQQVSSWF